MGPRARRGAGRRDGAGASWSGCAELTQRAGRAGARVRGAPGRRRSIPRCSARWRSSSARSTRSKLGDEERAIARLQQGARSARPRRRRARCRCRRSIGCCTRGGALARSRRRAREGGAGVDRAAPSRPSSSIGSARCARASSSISTARCSRIATRIDPRAGARGDARGPGEAARVAGARRGGARGARAALRERQKWREGACSSPRCASAITSGHAEQAALLETHRRALREGAARSVARARRDGAGAAAASPTSRGWPTRSSGWARRPAIGAARGRYLRAGARRRRLRRRGRRAISACARRGCGSELGEADRAEARYLYVLEVDADNGDALEALDRIYRARGGARRAGRASCAARRRASTTSAEKKRLYAEAARAARERARRHAAARSPAGARCSTSTTADERRARRRWRACYERDEHWQELVELLAQKVRFEEDPGAQVGLKSRIAAIWAEKLGDLDQAVDAYRDLLDHAPDSLRGARRARGAGAAARRLLGGAGGAGAPAPGRRRRAAADPRLQEAGGPGRRQAQVARRRDRLPARDPCSCSPTSRKRTRRCSSSSRRPSASTI